MNILAIDTATDSCSVAILKDQTTYALREIKPQAHTKIILGMCEQILKESDLKKEELDLIACGRGPGSFTGVRIAVAIAQGLAFGLGIKAIGISDLRTLAESIIEAHQDRYERILVANDARMNEVYYCAYEYKDQHAMPLMEERVAAPHIAQDQFKKIIIPNKTLLVGTGFLTYEPLKELITNDQILAEDHLPHAKNMLKLASDLYNEAVDPEDLAPIYIRDQVTWKKVSEQGKR